MRAFQEQFYVDPYRREFSTTITSCTKEANGYAVTCEDTIFYPEGGGQPADHGTMNGIAVVDVKRKSPTEIVHWLTSPIEVGSSVNEILDWDRRFDFMQQHSGEHIFSGLIHQRFGYENVGFHLNEETILIDFDGFLTWSQVLEIEAQANALIWENIPIEASFPTAEQLKDIPYRSKKELQGEIRIVTIPGGDVCACCGTHVKRTGEIGLIKANAVVKHQNGSRIELLCGKRAYLDDVKKTNANNELMRLCSAKRYDTVSHVERLLKENAEKQKTISMLTKQVLEIRLQQATTKKLSIDFFEKIDARAARDYANALVEQGKAEIAAVLFREEENKDWNYIIRSDKFQLREYACRLNETLSGRGGGRDDTIQGSFTKDETEIQEALRAVFPV